MSNSINAYAAQDAESPLAPFSFSPRELGDNDIKIKILYCGVCHSDLHQAKNDWKGSSYPLVPGHEIVGKIEAVGSSVKNFKVNDSVAVGCMVDSCLSCPTCDDGEEQFCQNGFTGTYNSKDRITGEPTYGGYAQQIIVREEFVLKIPEGMNLKKVAPILCAGITTYSPLKKWDIKPGDKVGVVGLGGLGHMALMLAHAMGAQVTLFTTSEQKKEEALKMGAHQVVISKNAEDMGAQYNQFKLIIDTVPVAHDVADYVRCLGIDGTLVVVGAIDNLPSFHSGLLIGGRKRVSASLIGGIQETQEVIDFCAKNEIYPHCEMIPMQNINEAFERMKKSQVKYRFVIDMESL